MRELDPGPSQVVGREELARLYGRGKDWAKGLLQEWWDEQQKGGDLRVFRRRARGGKPGRFALYTTRAVLHRHMPPARDIALVRAVEAIARDADFNARRVNELDARVRFLEAQLARRR